MQIDKFLVSLDEKILYKRSKFEKPSELSKEIEKCALIEVMKGGFLQCLTILKIKHKAFLIPMVIHVKHQLKKCNYKGLEEYEKTFLSDMI